LDLPHLLVIAIIVHVPPAIVFSLGSNRDAAGCLARLAGGQILPQWAAKVKAQPDYSTGQSHPLAEAARVILRDA